MLTLWHKIVVEQELPIETGHELKTIEREADGCFRVVTSRNVVRANQVCLALGRRGSPRKLGVPGEDLSKVSYNLLDAESYQGRNLLVVGGGDSAVEAALGLAEQPGNQVLLSYRQENFTRLKARNEARLLRAAQAGQLEIAFRSEVLLIGPNEVELKLAGSNAGAPTIKILPNDEVFVFAGGAPPFTLLAAAGVSFDHSSRPPTQLLADRSSGLSLALGIGLIATIAVLAWAWLNHDYYFADRTERMGMTQHEWLRSSRSLGLGAGLAAAGFLFANLSYLLRRTPRLRLRAGSLQAWMTAHVATGILALVAATLHAGFELRNDVGGHALLGLLVLVVTGMIGRYFYSFVPHAANGRELVLDELRSELAQISAQWDRGSRGFGARVREAMDQLLAEGRSRGSMPARIAMRILNQRTLRQTLSRLSDEGAAEGIPADELTRTLHLARHAHRTALMAARYEEARSLLASWRYLHRWIALLMVLLLAVHVITALRFAGLGA